MSKKRRRVDIGKDHKKKTVGRRIPATEKCSCLCHDPKTKHIVFHFAPCCGHCRYCGEKRIKVFYLDSHKNRCRQLVIAANASGPA